MAEWQTLTYFGQGDIQIGCSDRLTCLTHFGYKEPTSPSKHYLSQKLAPPTSSWDFWCAICSGNGLLSQSISRSRSLSLSSELHRPNLAMAMVALPEDRVAHLEGTATTPSGGHRISSGRYSGSSGGYGGYGGYGHGKRSADPSYVYSGHRSYGGHGHGGYSRGYGGHGYHG